MGTDPLLLWFVLLVPFIGGSARLLLERAKLLDPIVELEKCWNRVFNRDKLGFSFINLPIVEDLRGGSLDGLGRRRGHIFRGRGRFSTRICDFRLGG